MATYRCLVDLFLPAPECRYVQAGDIVADEPNAVNAIPVGWRPPTHAVSPLDPDATQRYWLEGPRLSDCQPWQAAFLSGNRWSGQPVPPPSTYWVRANPKNREAGYVLSGAGSNYGPQPPGSAKP